MASRYPENPFWDQTNDRPIHIDSEDEWERASADGHLTPDHVLSRIESMLDAEFNEDSAYDSDGFFRSLIAVGHTYQGGIKLVVHTDDHDPPHVHVQLNQSKHEFRLVIETADLMKGDSFPDGQGKKCKKAQEILMENKQLFTNEWAKTRPTA